MSTLSAASTNPASSLPNILLVVSVERQDQLSEFLAAQLKNRVALGALTKTDREALLAQLFADLEVEVASLQKYFQSKTVRDIVNLASKIRR